MCEIRFNSDVSKIICPLLCKDKMGTHNRENQVSFSGTPLVEAISAVTLATTNMPETARFYCSLGFKLIYGGPEETFVSFRANKAYVNLILKEDETVTIRSWPGRIIFHVSDVDALYERLITLGLKPESMPRDAEWGERYFHIVDPDGNELSFAMPN